MSNYSRVGIKELTDARLDANYYAPRFLENEKNLAQCGLPRKKIFEISELCNCGATPVDVAYSSDGVGLVRTSDVRPNHFKAEGVLRTNDLDLSDLRESVIARPGDLLYTMSGTIGYACVIPDDEMPVSFSNTVARVRLPKQSPYDAHYIAVFFNCHYGYEQSLRLVSGGIQGHVMPNPFKALLVALPNSVAQKYIGDKVRQAERLRAWAARAQEKAVRQMPAYKPMISHYEKSSYRVSTDSLVSARLDSSFFHPDHRALDCKMKESGCQYLGKIASAVKLGWNKETSDSFLYYEIGGLNVSNGTIVPVETLTSEAPSRATTAVKHGDVLVSTVRPNRKNVGFVIEDEQDIPMVATSGFSVIRFESLVDAAFYHAWLRTDDATSQLMRWNSGSAYPAIDEDVPLQIFVPEFDASLRERLGQTLLDTHFALLHSAKLTNAAKLLVEDLIKGQITEAQLIAAEQALQAGNDTLDRKILSRLKTDGIDGDGAALFSDLDELYRLLALAEVE